MANGKSIVPTFPWDVPKLNHVKTDSYIDFPVVHNAIATDEPFYVEYDFIIATTDLTTTTLSKWNGSTFVAVTGLTNPDLVAGRGYYAVTTTAANYVTISEVVTPPTQ
jgi:hypothetical protein